MPGGLGTVQPVNLHHVQFLARGASYGRIAKGDRLVISGIFGFLLRCLRTIPWIALVAGPILCAAGLATIFSVNRFAERAVAAEVHVIRVDERRQDDGPVYRPVFGAPAPDGTALEYAGDLWIAPAQHAAGEVVPGRVDYDTGEIRSLRLMDGQAQLGEGTLGLGIACLLLAGVYFASRALNRDFRDSARRRRD